LNELEKFVFPSTSRFLQRRHAKLAKKHASSSPYPEQIYILLVRLVNRHEHRASGVKKKVASQKEILPDVYTLCLKFSMADPRSAFANSNCVPAMLAITLIASKYKAGYELEFFTASLSLYGCL
jgi:hypothetical protein